MAIKIFNKKSHIIYFNTKNGFFEREIINYDTRPTFPDLLDISLTNMCELECDFCYKNSHMNGKHIPKDKLFKIIDEASKNGVVQIAYGGGNPNQHPDFVEILKYTRQSGIIPNFTTNGTYITDEIIKTAKEYCGAVAISLYDDISAFKVTLYRLAKANIKVNVHIVVSGDNINSIINKLTKINDISNLINAIVLLNYKPIREEIKHVKIESQDFIRLIKFLETNGYSKIGFDSCFTSYVSKILRNKNITMCDAGTYSAYISEDLKMYPCSFAINEVVGHSLEHKKISDIWHTKSFIDFKSTRKVNECEECKMINYCNKGCHLFDINNCYAL